MLNRTKPHKLSPGDTVAAVSLSWGGAGDLPLRWRYALAKRRQSERIMAELDCERRTFSITESGVI